MEFAWRFQNNMLRAFTVRTEGLMSNCVANHDQHDVFQRFIEVPINTKEFEIPCCCRGPVEDAVYQNLYHPTRYNYKKVVVPLYINYTDQKRTGDAIITSMFTNTSMNLKHLSDGKGKSYYGTKGLIFDGNYNPLLLATVRCSIIKVGEPENTTNEDFLAYKSTTLRISPLVFEQDNIVEKTIKKKLINLYTTKEIDCIYSAGTGTDLRDIKVSNVIIEDFSHWFVKPIIPTLQDTTNEKLNKLVEDYITDLR